MKIETPVDEGAPRSNFFSKKNSYHRSEADDKVCDTIHDANESDKLEIFITQSQSI